MSQALMDYMSAVHSVTATALELMLTERGLSDETSSVIDVTDAEADLDAAAAGLAGAVGALPAPHSRRPAGWDDRRARPGRPESARRRILAVVAARLNAAYSDDDREAASQFGEAALAEACRDLGESLEKARAAKAEAAGRLI